MIYLYSEISFWHLDIRYPNSARKFEKHFTSSRKPKNKQQTKKKRKSKSVKRKSNNETQTNFSFLGKKKQR